MLTIMILTLTLAGQINDGLNITASTAVKSQYLLTVGAVAHTKPISESSLTLRYHDWYFNVWSAWPLSQPSAKTTGNEVTELALPEWYQPSDTVLAMQNLNSALAELRDTLNPPTSTAAPFTGEIDLTIGRVWEFEQLTLDVWVSWFLLWPDLSDFSDDMWTGGAKLTFTRWETLQPWFRMSYYDTVGTNGPSGFWYAFAGVDAPIKLWQRNDGSHQILNLGTSAAWTNNKFNQSGLVYWRALLNADIRLHENVFLTPSLLYQHRLMDSDFANKNEWVIGLGIKIEF